MDALQPADEGGEAAIVLVGGEADFVVEVWPGGGGCEGFQGQRVQGEGGDDVGSDAGGGGRGETDYGGCGVGGAEVGEMDVGGAEVVAPFTDACGCWVRDCVVVSGEGEGGEMYNGLRQLRCGQAPPARKWFSDAAGKFL